MDAVNPRLNAVVARPRRPALAEAAAATQRYAHGAPLAALDGIPLTVKDNLPSADLPTTWGRPALRRITARRTTNWPSAARAPAAR